MRQRLFILLFLITALTAFGQTKSKIFTADIDNFWQAYDSVKTTKDTLKQLEFIQKLYLDKASDGLKEFMAGRDHSAKRHLKNILKCPKFWTSIRPHTLLVNSYEADIEKIMLSFKKLYPNFREPDVYFTIGLLNSGGTITKDKILIGTEMASADSTVDASEVASWLRGFFKDNVDVVSMVAHEVGHTQQEEHSTKKYNLLGYCIREGSCDFIAELLLQEPIISPYMTYGQANEKTLWKKFVKKMDGEDFKDWLYNGHTAPNGQADLGYFIGYVICKSYYEKTTDKQKALKEIIELDYTKESVQKFLTKSGYNGGQR